MTSRPPRTADTTPAADSPPTPAQRTVTLTLPARPHLADLIWYTGAAVLAAVEAVEWPVAALIAAGHLLIRWHRERRR